MHSIEQHLLYRIYGKEHMLRLNKLVNALGIPREVIAEYLYNKYNDDDQYSYIEFNVFSGSNFEHDVIRFVRNRIPSNDIVGEFLLRIRLLNRITNYKISEDEYLCEKIFNVKLGTLTWKHVEKELRKDEQINDLHLKWLEAIFKFYN